LPESWHVDGLPSGDGAVARPIPKGLANDVTEQQAKEASVWQRRGGHFHPGWH